MDQVVSTPPPRRPRVPMFSLSLGLGVLVLVIAGTSFLVTSRRASITPSSFIALEQEAFGSLTANLPDGGKGTGLGANTEAARVASSDLTAVPEGFTSYLPLRYSFSESLVLNDSLRTVYRDHPVTLPSVNPSLGFAENRGWKTESLRLRTADDTYEMTIDQSNVWFFTIAKVRSFMTQSTLPVKQLEQAVSRSDAEVLTAAQKVLTEWGISTDGFREPTITQDFFETTPFYKTVVWGIVLDGIPVVQSDGTPSGISVTLATTDLSLEALSLIKRPDSVTQKSEYPLASVSDVTSLIPGGGYAQSPAAEQVKTVALGQPEQVLMSEIRTEGQLYVPALRFPVTNPDASTGKYLVVPVSEDLVRTRLQPVEATPLDTVRF
jgi:hypothetical protein